jgi:translation initiation factor 1A
MPKNKGAGGKNRRKGKGTFAKPKELIYKDEGQEYGRVTKSLGNGFMEVHCFDGPDGTLRRAHIRGKMRKKIWMGVNDIVLVNIRDFQDRTCDILLKYSSDEARILRSRKEIPNNSDVNQTDVIEEDDNIHFGSNDAEIDHLNENKIEEKSKSKSKEKPKLKSKSKQKPDSNSDSDSDSEEDYIVPNQNRKFDLPSSESDSDSEIDAL